MEPFASAGIASEPFARRFREQAGSAMVLPFSAFMDLALYDPEVGYYRSKRLRVGKAPGADFITSSTMAPVFGELVAAAAAKLIGPGEAASHVFVEIGAEPGKGVLTHVEHPFAGVRQIHVGEPFTIPPRAVVFSNELFDAQPFSRVVFENGHWRESGVRLENALSWTLLDEPTPEVAASFELLPHAAPDGYTLDLPLRAGSLLEQIARLPWAGLFLAIDYGRTWKELCEDHPHGTGRGYRGHRMAENLLDHPGEQDLTCHVCWDWLKGALDSAGFSSIARTPQESFFVHHGTEAIARIIGADTDPLSLARTQLKHLLHPALMGQRFEVLSGIRR